MYIRVRGEGISMLGCFMSEKCILRTLAGIVALLAAIALAGCSGDEQTDFGNGTDTPNTPQATNAPATLSGRSYTFTVTANQSFADEFNSGYVIDFQSETAYLLHPSPQNLRP